MVSLLDLAAYTVKVNLRGNEIEMGGLPTKDFAELLREHPTLRSILEGQWKSGGVTVDAKQLFIEVPAAVHEIIARCLVETNGASREAVLAKVTSLSVADQLALLRGAFEATMPDGPGPFADAAASILAGSWGKPKPMEDPLPGMTVSDASAPLPWSASLQVDMTSPPLGVTRPGNSSPGVH